MRTGALALFLAQVVPRASAATTLRRTAPEAVHLAASQAGQIPALQPTEVYDADFPIDTAKLTPQELRYKAQSDYAKAIAMLKRERAQAEAAQHAMEEALKAYQDALAAAKQAKLNAEAALKNKEKYEASAAAAASKANTMASHAEKSDAALQQEKQDLATAEAAYQKALKGTEGAEAKIAALKAEQAALAKKIQELEAESGTQHQNLASERQAVAGKKDEVAAAHSDFQTASDRYAQEQAEADAALQSAEAAKARLAKSQKAASYKDSDAAALQAEIAKKQKDFDNAEAKYMREKTDAEMASKQAARAKANLAKFEEVKSAAPSWPRLTFVSTLFAVAMSAI